MQNDGYAAGVLAKLPFRIAALGAVLCFPFVLSLSFELLASGALVGIAPDRALSVADIEAASARARLQKTARDVRVSF